MKLGLILSFSITLLLSTNSWTQQMPQYTQFTQNKSLFNPAAMALNQHQAITMASRWQMLGFGLEPKTVSLYGQMKYQKKIKVIFNPASRIGEEIVATSKKQKIKLNHYFGGQIVSDNYGAFKSTNFDGNYALSIPINAKWKASVGLKIGIANNSFNANQASVLNSANPLLPYNGGDITYDEFTSGKLNKLNISSGAGFTISNKEFYLSIAALNLNKNKFSFGNSSIDFDQRIHFNLMTGYNFKIANGFDLQTAILLKKMYPTNLSIEGSAIATINYIFWGGINYRHASSLGFCAGMEITDALKIGYSLDFPTTRINKFSNGGHEIMMSYAF